MAKERPLHGGNIYQEAQKLGVEPSELIDFSANINPLGMPPNLMSHLHRCLDMCVNYPDPDSNKLKNQLSEYIGVDKTNICVGNGALEIIYLIFDSIDVKKIVIPAPTFNEYEKAAKSSGVEVAYYERQEKAGFKVNFEELFDFTVHNKAGAILLCNPNNPTSTLEEAGELVSLVAKCSEREIKVIIDEAFIELTKMPKENSVASLVKDFDNLYVIRAFTKIFAIPGLRLGYCVSSQGNIARLEAKQPSWPINTLASEAGIVFESDEEYIRKTNEWINIEPNYLYKELCEFPEIKAFPPSTNFILCKLLAYGWDAERLKSKLIEDKILIRNAENFVFLDNTYFRIAVKERDSNNHILKALKKINWR